MRVQRWMHGKIQPIRDSLNSKKGDGNFNISPSTPPKKLMLFSRAKNGGFQKNPIIVSL